MTQSPESLEPGIEQQFDADLVQYCEKIIIEHVYRHAGQFTMHRFADEFAEHFGEEHPYLGKEAVLNTVRSMMGTELTLTANRTVAIGSPTRREFREGFQEKEALQRLKDMIPAEHGHTDG